ncbi:hypothetical protein WJ47_17385 [Burkholderia ubonensis]|uniref:General secretion pathway protein GspM n=1 Tax=Burkholderia ubonensis TaxID=101571 RepID=A0AB73FXJ7_9BURK|nr:hypothetical protein [Burkholderia ubonensis]KVL61872.1 hypothetical protein WJ47_17385 [Burkholderia ubonensis]KVM28651.1 hypothetical protein WJ53_09375 [Burkholderia ubonensis]KVM35161.1 hypothetical protein WJ54_36370 [Burkholderia ubonensis]
MKHAWFRPRVTLDLVRSASSRSWAIIALWLVALLMCLVVWRDWMLLKQEDEQVDLQEQRLAALSAQQERAMQRKLGPTPEQVRLRAMFVPRPMGAPILLDRIGQAMTPDVALLRIDVDVPNQAATLELEAKSALYALNFLQSLDAQPGVSATIRKTTRKSADPQNPVTATLAITMFREPR